eukprot:Tbor_TRINITY_DN5912_c0_g2::TRINITY_DN5912_c0_g2_i1::g.18706::m.18706
MMLMRFLLRISGDRMAAPEIADPVVSIPHAAPMIESAIDSPHPMPPQANGDTPMNTSHSAVKGGKTVPERRGKIPNTKITIANIYTNIREIKAMASSGGILPGWGIISLSQGIYIGRYYIRYYREKKIFQ